MKEKRTYLQRELFASLFPIQAIAAGLPAINSFIISFIIGKYVGTAGLAAMGFLSPVNHVVSAFTGLLSTGLQIMSGRFLGKGNPDGIRKAFSTSIFTGATVGALLSLLVFLAPYCVAGLLGATGELQTMVADYLRGFAPSFFLLIASSGFLLCLQMDNAKILSVLAIVVQLLSSVTLSYFFTEIRDLGLFGVGLSMTVANLLLTLICCFHFIRSKLFRCSVKCVSVNVLKEMAVLGLSVALINVWLFIRGTFFNHAVFALGGVVAMSAMTVAMNITTAIGCTIESGMAGATRIIASVFVGERSVKGLRGLHKNAAVFTLPISLTVYALIFLLAGRIALLFGAEPENIAVYVTLIRLFNLWMVINPLKAPLMSLYSAMGRVKLTNLFCFLFMLLCPLAVIALGKLFGSIGLVASISVISDALLYVGFVIYYIMKVHRIPKGVFKVCYIPRDFGVPKEDTVAFFIMTQEEAAEDAVLLTDFCRAHGMEERLCLNCGLCLEEVAVGTVSRFPERKGDRYRMEVSGFFEDGHFTLTFHDNLPAFDPENVLKLYRPGDLGEGLNFKIISSVAEEMKYSLTLGMNTLSIRI